jgi:hypothetical protein
MKLFEQKSHKTIKSFFKRIIKPFKKRDFMLKFLTVTMTLALLLSSVLPYILR